MAENPYAGLWDVSLDVEAIHREVQRHVDAAVFDFAKGLLVSFDKVEGDLELYATQAHFWAEGDIAECERKSLAQLLRDFVYDYSYAIDGQKRCLDASDVEPVFRTIEEIIAGARAIYKARD